MKPSTLHTAELLMWLPALALRHTTNDTRRPAVAKPKMVRSSGGKRKKKKGKNTSKVNKGNLLAWAMNNINHRPFYYPVNSCKVTRTTVRSTTVLYCELLRQFGRVATASQMLFYYCDGPITAAVYYCTLLHSVCSRECEKNRLRAV